jgi:hypothetical protein
MIPTQAQLNLLRTQPHSTRLYLSVYQPSTVLACRVNNVGATTGDRSIPFDSVTSGNYALVQSGMTLYVGSIAGAFDKGMVRVKSASSGVLTVAENSHINWKDDDYLTVINFFEINAVYPRIIQNPLDELQTIWYKDYDIEYIDQNTVLGSFINMGPHYAGFRENGICNVYYSASGTSNLLGENLAYSWFFEGASVTGSSVLNPGNISYSTPGHYTTRLTVTSTSGGIDTSYRHVSIYDRPEQGINAPITQWSFSDMSGSRDQGGYSAKISIQQSIPQNLIRDGSLIVIFADDWYGNIHQSIGGNALGRESVVFVGYVLKGSIQYNYRDSTVEFEVGSPSEVMKLSEGFSVSIQSSGTTAEESDNISPWINVDAMTVRRALYHYLRWHSTVLMTNDFEFVGLDRPLQFFDADRTSLYDAVQSAMQSILVGGVTCDRQGKIWSEVDLYIKPEYFATTFTLTNRDWMEEVKIEESYTEQTSFVECGGVAFDGSTSTPLISQAPGMTPGYRGSVEQIQGLALLDQDELDQITGRIYSQRNLTYPNVEVDLVGNYRNFDIAPQERVPITLVSTDTLRGITFNGKRFFVGRVSWRHDPESETFLPSISFIERGDGVKGIAVVIDTDPDDPPVIPGVPVPVIPPPPPDGWDIPPINPPVIPPVIPPSGTGSGFGGLVQWSPVLTANVGGVDKFADAGGFGGVNVGTGGDVYLSVVLGFPPHNTGRVNAQLLWYQLGGGGLMTVQADISSQNIGGSSADSNTYTEVRNMSGIGWRKSTPVALNWSGEHDVCLILCTYNITLTSPTGVYLLGVILDWTQ